MKKNISFFFFRVVLPGLAAWLILSGGYYLLTRKEREAKAKRSRQEQLLKQINARAPYKFEKNHAPGRTDQPGMAAFHEFLMTFDPATGTVPHERIMKAIEVTRALSSLKSTRQIQWQGYPSNMGGRTRAIMYDPNDVTGKKVWAGGVTGGLWYNNDITSAQSTWVPVGDFWSNLAIRCLAYDPVHTHTFYAGTGEAETAMETYRESSGLGYGIGRSDDGGLSWYHIPGTEQFAYVTDIVIRRENNNSVIYAGVASGLYKDSQHLSQPSDGLFRSADGGATWTQVLPLIPGSTVPYSVSDIALGADNRLYVGTRPNLDGEGAAVILTSGDGLNWTANTDYQAEILGSGSNNIPGRVVLATAPSDSNVVYALIASGFVNSANGFNYFYCYHILRSSDKGVTWVKKNVPTDLTSGTNFATIAWHALDIAVDPNNANRLFIGGLDVHGSSNGGSSWTRVSDWSLMYSGGGSMYLHADQHAIVYKSGSSSQILFGTDGGVFFTSSGTLPNPDFEERNKGYSTLQFYTCAIHPEAGTDKFYGGLQDNGSLFYNGNPLTIFDMVSGGDGACCFFDEDDPSLSITSYYYNNYYIFKDGNFINFAGNWSSGTFVSPSDFDSRLNILYCNPVDYLGNYSDRLLRLEDLESNPTGTFVNLNTGTGVLFTAVRVSPFSPDGKSTVFMGTESGRLFKVQEAQGNSPVVMEIGGTSFPAASLSCIAFGQSENTITVTFSNYGVPSVWRTVDGGQHWTDIEGNLPDMPVRWAISHPQNENQILLATETGIWECANPAAVPVKWFPHNDGMANVRVDMLQVRTADNTVLAATHGRGLFTTTWDVLTTTREPQPGGTSVFPNPTTGQATLMAHLGSSGTVLITVSDLTGKKLRQEQVTARAGMFRHSISLESLPAGSYLVSLSAGGHELFTKKIILYQ